MPNRKDQKNSPISAISRLFFVLVVLSGAAPVSLLQGQGNEQINIGFLQQNYPARATAMGTFDASGYYIVAVGDTIYGISHRFGHSVLNFMAMNGIAPGQVLTPGQSVSVILGQLPPGSQALPSPAASPTAYSGSPGTTSSYISPTGNTGYNSAVPGVITSSLSGTTNSRSDTSKRLTFAEALTSMDAKESPADALPPMGHTVRIPPKRKSITEEELSKPAVVLAKYKVETGDTLFDVARRYDVDVLDVVAINKLEKPYTIRVGQVLTLPLDDPELLRDRGIEDSTPFINQAGGLSQIARAGRKDVSLGMGSSRAPQTLASDPPVPQVKPSEAALKREPARPPAVIKVAKTETKENPDPVRVSRFVWPKSGSVLVGFGENKNGKPNRGIDIAINEGDYIRAADDGIVSHATDEIRKYGNLILIAHPDGWVTAYGHNQQILVKAGEKVQRGQIIAKGGKTGAVSRPTLHFEVLKDNKQVNPLKYL